MNSRQSAEKLLSLLTVDRDAAQCYAQASERVNPPWLREQLQGFRHEHERHIGDLRVLIHDLQQQELIHPSSPSEYQSEGIFSLSGISDPEQVFHILEHNEIIINRHYDEARRWRLFEAARIIIEHHFDDEQRHLHYIRDVLFNRSWERV
jgi:rubrerythrin